MHGLRALGVTSIAWASWPEALSAFRRLKAQLREDLGVSPSAETETLFTRILRGGNAGGS